MQNDWLDTDNQKKPNGQENRIMHFVMSCQGQEVIHDLCCSHFIWPLKEGNGGQFKSDVHFPLNAGNTGSFINFSVLIATQKIEHFTSKKWRSIFQTCHSSENNRPFFTSKTEPFLSHYIVTQLQKNWEEVGISQMWIARKGKRWGLVIMSCSYFLF